MALNFQYSGELIRGCDGWESLTAICTTSIKNEPTVVAGNPRFSGITTRMEYTQRMNAPKAQTSLARSLLASAGRKVLVRFTRPFESGSVMGYVIDIGPQFFLLALVDENIRFNGFQCFRLQDVRKLQVPAKCANFVETALRLRRERIPKSGRVKVGNLQELLRTAGRAFPIITINREKVAPDICHIGRVEEVSDSHLSLLEIGPDGRWDDAPLSYRTKEITRIDFGGDYEQALTLVGGEHPIV